MNFSSRTGVLAILLVVAMTLSGCAQTVTRDLYTEIRSTQVKNDPSEKMEAVMSKYLGENWRKEVDQESIFYGTNDDTGFRAYRFSWHHDVEQLPSDRNMFIFRQFKGEKPRLYRYMLIAIANTEGRGDLNTIDIIKKHKGKYIMGGDRRFHAKVPESLTDGVVLTDWHFCLVCYGSRATTPETLTVKDIEYIEDVNEQRLDLIKIVDEKQLRGLGALNMYEKYGEIPIVSGDAAIKAQKQYAQVKQSLQSDIYANNQAWEKYNEFQRNEYSPLTFEAWEKKQGCEPPRWDRRLLDESIAKITAYLGCKGEALNTYDLKTYIAAYPELDSKEKALRSNLVGNSRDFKKVASPEEMMEDAQEDMQAEIDLLDRLYDQKRLDARVARAQAQNEAWANQQLQNTADMIDQMHEDTLNQALADNQRMVDIASAQRQREMDEVNRQMQELQEQQRAAKRKIAEAKRRTQQQQATETVDMAQVQAKSNTPDTTTSQPQMDKKDSQAEEKPNRMVGSGRDYEMYGSTEVYHPYDTAVDVAKTNLRNKAAKFCNSSYKADITWGETNCKKSEHADTYQCSVGALINCWEQRCDSEFCGTRN